MPSNKVKNPEQMTHKKFVPGANPLVQIPRGFVAGTAGLPGDIEGLARLFAKYAGAPNSLAEKWGQQETPTLPTSEFYKEWLPLKDEGIGAEELNTLGSLAGGMGSTTLTGLAAKYGAKATKAAIANAAAPSHLSKQAGVIKAKGLAGNWLAGSPDSALSRLKGPGRDVPAAISEVQQLLAAAPEGSAAQATYQQLLGEMSRKQAINQFVDKQLTNYIKSDMATPTDPVRLAIEAWPEKKQKLQGLAQAKLDFLNAKTQRLMAERDVPEEFLTRHRQEVLAAEKAKERIDLQEASHRQVAPEDIRDVGDDWISEELGVIREQAGFPEEGLAKTGPAQDWETITDQSVLSLPAKRYQKEVGPNWEANKWLDKTAPDVAVHSIAYPQDFADSLGFSHLIDELKNAANSASGLPKDLLLDPSTLGKTTLPQAVEHVSKINAWRAAQKAEADLVKANNAATVLHKDYPEKGFKWVELRKNQDLPEGYTVRADTIGTDKAPKPGFAVFRPDGTRISVAYGPTEAKAISNYHQTAFGIDADKRTAQLQDALKYEGDTMVHCVGGYCPDVAEGRSRIYSLRNTKTGRPHVTIETMPSGSNSVRSLKEGNPEDYRINQIKGYKNLKPADEYLPYVQDFVKSGNWSDVKDLRNTGLVKYNNEYVDPATLKPLQDEAANYMQKHPAFEAHRKAAAKRDAYDTQVGSPEYYDVEKAAGTPLHSTMPYTYREQLHTLTRPEEFADHEGDFTYTLTSALERYKKLKELYGPLPDAPEGFAHGGSVYSPERVDEIVTQHRNSEYDPARVDALVAQLKEEMYG